MLPSKPWKAESLIWLLMSLFIALGSVGLVASLVDQWLASPLMVSERDLKDFGKLVFRLKSRSDGVSAYLAGRLSAKCKSAIDQFKGEPRDVDALKPLLVEELNKIIGGPLIYEEARFSRIQLRPETKRSLDSRTGRLQSRRLNRLLLEDAYPEELGRTDLSDSATEARQVWLQVGFTPVFQVITFFLVGRFLKKNNMTWTEAFGSARRGLGRNVLLAIGSVLFVMPVSLGLLWLSRKVMEFWVLTPELQTMVKALESAQSWDQYILLGVTAILLAPAWEELVFRGILFSAVKQAGFPRLAWIGTSLLFAAVHVNLVTFLSLFAVGAVMVWLYQRTENLVAPIFAHALFNGVNFAWMIIGNSHF
ncbi:MAG TPA: CPBP family intramembrane metalloprotease [Verrucomicrobiota bacterium]|nr:CPBP family intramembrane metalloprotease [Verrucomicrobiota bacterium]